MQVQVKPDQTGTLYEMPLLAVILILAGAVLAPSYPFMSVLLIAGLIVLFLPYVLHSFLYIRNRWHARRVMNELQTAGFTGNEYIITSGAGLVLVLGPPEGEFVCIPAPAFEGEEEQAVVRGWASEIGAVEYEPVTYTRLGGASRIVYYVRLRHGSQSVDMEFPGKWRAKRAVKKLKKYLAGKVVVTEK